MIFRERIRELNLNAHAFADTLLLLQGILFYQLELIFIRILSTKAEKKGGRGNDN